MDDADLVGAGGNGGRRVDGVAGSGVGGCGGGRLVGFEGSAGFGRGERKRWWEVRRRRIGAHACDGVNLD